MTAYRERIFSILEPELRLIPTESALDFGCGDGWFTKRFTDTALLKEITPLEVKHRAGCLVTPKIYDGNKIPFADREFDLVYAMDVLHHCGDPYASLREMMRCTRKYLILKDHRHESVLGWLALCILDELGNRRFDIPSLYHYQQNWSWLEHIEAEGFRRVFLKSPAPVHQGLLGSLTNHLQFIGIWERQG